MGPTSESVVSSYPATTSPSVVPLTESPTDGSMTRPTSSPNVNKPTDSPASIQSPGPGLLQPPTYSPISSVKPQTPLTGSPTVKPMTTALPTVAPGRTEETGLPNQKAPTITPSSVETVPTLSPLHATATQSPTLALPYVVPSAHPVGSTLRQPTVSPLAWPSAGRPAAPGFPPIPTNSLRPPAVGLMAIRAPMKTKWWYKSTLGGKRKGYHCGIKGVKQGKGKDKPMCREKMKGFSKHKSTKKKSSKATSHDNGHLNDKFLVTQFGHYRERPSMHRDDKRLHNVFGDTKDAEIHSADDKHFATNSFTSNALSKFLESGQGQTPQIGLVVAPETGLPQTLQRLRSGA
jgi:hypothetical protein